MGGSRESDQGSTSMFGSFVSKLAGGDEEKAKQASDFAERIAGKDLDGDGTIAGVPIQKEQPQPTQEPQQQPQQHNSLMDLASSFGGGGEGGGLDFGTILSQGQSFLSKSGALKPKAGGGGFAGLLNAFKGFSPGVQQKADTQIKNLDDGRNIPLSTLDGNKKSLLIGINYFGTSNELKGC